MLYHKQKKKINMTEVMIREWVHRIAIVLFGAIIVWLSWF
jgi:hypothetical protein